MQNDQHENVCGVVDQCSKAKALRTMVSAVFAALALVLLPACSDNDELLPLISEEPDPGPPEEPDNLSESCRKLPIQFADGKVGEFDADALEFRIFLPEAPHESGPTWTYASVEDFVAEGKATGRRTRVEEWEYTGGPAYSTRYDYSSEKRLVQQTSSETDHGLEEWEHMFSFDTWDDMDRPLRAFVDTSYREEASMQYSSVCIDALWTHQYDDDQRQETTTVVPGTGSECTSRVIVQTFDDDNFELKKEVWLGSTSAEGEPDRAYENEVLSRESVCLPANQNVAGRPRTIS